MIKIDQAQIGLFTRMNRKALFTMIWTHIIRRVNNHPHHQTKKGTGQAQMTTATSAVLI